MNLQWNLGNTKSVHAKTLITKSKDLRGKRKPEFPRTGLDQTETSPGLGHVFANIFRSDRVGDKDFGPVRVRVFFTGVSHIFSKNFKNEVELNGNHTSHSQPGNHASHSQPGNHASLSKYSKYSTLISML